MRTLPGETRRKGERNLSLYLLLFLLPFCGREPAQPDHFPLFCKPPDLNYPERFVDCPAGSGSFGRWIVDDFGLPAYEYTLHQEKDRRAVWWNSSGKEKRTHWHQIGNFRFVAVADNYGSVQVFTEENGFQWLNYFSESEKNFAGNFSILDDGERVWTTSYRFKPEGGKTRRVFGMGYLMTETEYEGIQVQRFTFAPYGDDPILISEITLKNHTSTPKTVDYYEYWDVNIHPVLLMLISSGVLDPSIPENNEKERSLWNRFFYQTVRIEDSFPLGIVETHPVSTVPDSFGTPGTERAKGSDSSPPDIFLLPLDGETGEGFAFTQENFFPSEKGEISLSTASLNFYRNDRDIPENLRSLPALYQPLMLLHKRKIRLEAGETKRIRYGYGYRPPSLTWDFLKTYTDPHRKYLEETLRLWKEKLVYFVPPRDFFLHREMAWHSYYLQSGSYWREYLKTHIVSQGGEYLFGHGADGATRDYCIFSVALNPINPSLSKEILRFIMLTTNPDGEMAYGNYGDTMVTGAVIHSQPSDLDIFFLWAIGEYLLSTGDYEFLEEKIPFYSPEKIFSQPRYTVLDHIRTAYNHLVYEVGTGDHGLIRIRTGDFSDGIVLFTENPSLTRKKGESTFNTAFASYALPLLADALEEADPALSQEMRLRGNRYAMAVKDQWGGSWYYRGREGDGRPFGHDRIFLEPQVWALLSGIPDPEQVPVLLHSILTILQSNSPIGARIVYPPKEDLVGGLSPGTDINGGIWHATNSFLAWAYSLYSPEDAWESFRKNTLTFHAETYPEIWYGIWSGPDSYNSPESDRPGEAGAHYATALADHPVMNMNQHANPLLALVRLAGIIPEKNGMTIHPRFPFIPFTLHLPAMGIQYRTNKISGYLLKTLKHPFLMKVTLPETLLHKNLQVWIDGKEAPFSITSSTLTFSLPATTEKTEWSVEERE